jgi:cytochrome b561
MIIFGVPLILGGLWLLLVLRMVVRTAGPKPGAADGAIITALALWLVHRYSWFYGCTAVLFFLFDALFAPRNKSSFLFAGVSAVGTAVVTLLLGDYAGSFAVSKAMGFLILGVIAAVLFLVLTEGRTQTRSDDGSHPLNRARLRAVQIGSLVLVVLLLYRTGLTGFTDTIPLLAAVSGAVLYRPIGLIRRHRG